MTRQIQHLPKRKGMGDISSLIDFIIIVYSAIHNVGRYNISKYQELSSPFPHRRYLHTPLPSTVHVLHVPMYSDTRLFRHCISSYTVSWITMFPVETSDAMPRFTREYRYSRDMRSDCIPHIRKARDAKIAHQRSMRSTLQYNQLPALVTNAMFFETEKLSWTLRIAREKQAIRDALDI